MKHDLGIKIASVARFLVVILTLCFLMPESQAQINELQARDMLVQRGIHEDTLRARLVNKGFDPDNITPEQLPIFQSVILETIQEIESDQLRNVRLVPEEAATPVIEIKVPDLAGTSSDPSPAPEILKEKVKIYGQEIFSNNTITAYQKADDPIAPDTYILGPGDRLGVIGYGRSQFDQTLDISREGFIQPSGLPKILVKGLRLSEARELLFQRFSQFYSIGRGEFQVTLTQSRNMTINVFGEAKTTGGFTLPGVNTAFNLISAAGGPTDVGSVRRIKIIRGSESIPLDVYEYMADPSVARNYFLQNNDIIHIPVAQKVVEIRGAVTRPMAYELLENENLNQLITYAGGSLANAFLSDVQVIRYQDDKKVITNINLRELKAAGGDYILLNGDVVDIKQIDEQAKNFVVIQGAITFPGQYERREGMRVADLLRQSQVKPDARLDFGYLLRYQPDSTFKYERLNLHNALNTPSSPDNVILADQDVVEVMALRTYAPPAYFYVSGAVKNPDTFAIQTDGSLKLEDAILMAGGPLVDASEFGYIMRMNPREPKTIEYVHFNLLEAFNQPATEANMEIKPGDQIFLFDKAGRRDDFSVSIFGAVRNPGKFPFGPGMRLADLISLAGGFAFEADNERIDIARPEFKNGESLKINQFKAQLSRDFDGDAAEDNSILLEPFDHVYVRTIPEFELQQTIRIDGEVKYPGTYPLLQTKERIYDLIERAGGLTGEAFPEGAKLFRYGDTTGLVVIDLHEILENKNAPSNIVMVHGDVISIPKSRDLVTIGGYVNLDEAYSIGFLNRQRSITVAFRGEKSAKYYIDRFAAGVSETGAPTAVKVQYADGRVEKTRKFLFFNQYPKVEKGAVVTVGPKTIRPVAEQEAEKKADWGSVLRDTMAQATAVLTLLILVDQLSK